MWWQTYLLSIEFFFQCNNFHAKKLILSPCLGYEKHANKLPCQGKHGKYTFFMLLFQKIKNKTVPEKISKQ